MQIKLSIPILQSLTNNEAFVYFCTLLAINQNPECGLKDIIRLSTFCESALINILNKLETTETIAIKRSKSGNRYSYTIPDKHYIIIDSSLLDIDLDRNVLGFLIRLKCWSRIASNYVDLSLNRIVHEIGVQHNTFYAALESGAIARNDKKTYIWFKHPSLTIY